MFNAFKKYGQANKCNVMSALTPGKGANDSERSFVGGVWRVYPGNKFRWATLEWSASKRFWSRGCLKPLVGRYSIAWAHPLFRWSRWNRLSRWRRGAIWNWLVWKINDSLLFTLSSIGHIDFFRSSRGGRQAQENVPHPRILLSWRWFFVSRKLGSDSEKLLRLQFRS